ncbi:efflux RND transporter periplasmic adaptor subunit [Lagierella sp.]|uniref:efflux RND transporter periplasmic adaptor subunit n=1 Tax=Lagierella sp. TaxID=2849657 RepID=UPI0026245CB7|nr:efflux RND transporter periplasmic adaptor subunit [Lagierella sp.]
MSKKNKIIISVVAVILIAATIIGLLIPKGKDKKEYSLYRVKGKDALSFSGTSKPVDVQNIFYDPTKGEIVKYHVKDKDVVQAGTDLFVYENPAVKEQIDELNRQYSTVKKSLNFANSDVGKANSDYSNAKANVGSLESKVKKAKDNLNSENPEEYAQQQAEIQQLQMEYEGAKQEMKAYEAQISPAKRAASETKSQLDGISEQIASLKNKQYTTEKAEISGQIYLDKNGENASQGATNPLIKIVSKDAKIVSSISEFDYDKIKVDDRVDLKVISTGESQKGTVKSVSNIPKEDVQIPGNGGGGSNLSEFEFTVIPDGFIQYGFSVNVMVKQDGLYIPESAVEEENEKTYVYKYEDGKAKKVEVQLIKEDKVYRVTEGLKLDDEIIEEAKGLKDGQEIKVKDLESNKKKDTKEDNKKSNSTNANDHNSTDVDNNNVEPNVETNVENNENPSEQKDMDIKDDSSQKG